MGGREESDVIVWTMLCLATPKMLNWKLMLCIRIDILTCMQLLFMTYLNCLTRTL